MMLRFFILAWLWLVVSFVMLWWVQVAMDRMHRGAAEAVGQAMRQGASVVVTDGRPQLSPTPPSAGPQDLARLEFDRRELMRRLRTLWISVTLVPLLIAGWYLSVLQSRLRAAEGKAAAGPVNAPP